MVNKAMATIFGYASPDEMIESVQDIERQSYGDCGDRADLIRRLEEHDAAEGVEYRCRRKDGAYIWLLESAWAVRDNAGRVLLLRGHQ